MPQIPQTTLGNKTYNNMTVTNLTSLSKSFYNLFSKASRRKHSCKFNVLE